MKFSELIDRIMSEVNTGGTEPFTIYRDKDGEWQYGFAQYQDGKALGRMPDIKEQDPFAVTFTGKDFARGSFPYVYDTVLYSRVREEYYVARNSGKDTDALHALTCFFQESISEFSQEITDYLTTLDRPLAALAELCPFDMSTDSGDWSFNEDLAEDAIDRIESTVNDRLRIRDAETAPEKRTIEGYTETNSIHVNGRLMFLGEKPDAEHRYMVCEFRRNNPFGLLESMYAGVTDDYLEALDKFRYLIEYNIGVVQSEREVRKNLDGVEPLTLTAAHCVLNGMDEDLTGKLIVIKADVLSPEYRNADHQLRICLGGFGASPHSRGNAVFCKDLFLGKESRFERYDVLGVADLDKLPQWAKVKMKAYEAAQTEQKVKSFPKPEQKKSSLLGRLDDAKAEAAARNAGHKDTPKAKKRGEMEVD